MTIDIAKGCQSISRLLLWRRLRGFGLRGALLRLLTALFENPVRVGLADGWYSSVIERQTGVPEGFALSPLLFALAFSPVLDALRATGVGVRAGGVWAGAFLLMHDVTLAAESHDDLKALAVALWEW